MKEFKKIAKILTNDFIVLAILEVILFILKIMKGTPIQVAISVIIFIAMVVGSNLASDGKQSAGIMGMIFAILMILTIFTGDIIDCILGVFLLIHSIKYQNAYVAKKSK